MKPYFLLAAVLLPIVAGVLMFPARLKTYRAIKLWTGAVTVITSALVWTLILLCEKESFVIFHFAYGLTFELGFDGLGRFFAGIVSVLWPLTVLYAFEYMKHDEHLTNFFAFFTMSYGITLGVSMSGNIFTMYCFYELLTLATVPLVIHKLTKKAVRAARTYFVFSLGGAAFAFASMTFLLANGMTGDFTFGGLMEAFPYDKPYITYIFYILGFFGFGVKAAMFPLHAWLPKAAVAPTPVTALLHAVAVVKSGAFAIIRLTYYSYGTDMLAGSWAQTVAMVFAAVTIFYGASRAVKEGHFKRRLAYSTVANLSYILFGVTIMTEKGLAAALLHMAFHAEIKILAFFCCGAVTHGTGRERVEELTGLGRSMPVTFGAFTVAALALSGIPPFSGFVSKWYLLTAAADSQNPVAYAGAAVLLAAALLTAIYMFTAVRRAWFPGKSEPSPLVLVREVDWRMTVPMAILAAAVLLTGVFAGPIVEAASNIASGLI